MSKSGKKAPDFKYIVDMRHKLLASVVLAGAFWASASGQSPTAQEKKDPLSFVRIAAGVAYNVQPETVSGSVGIYIDEQNWASALKDGDLGPFIKIKEAKAGRSAACFFPEAKDSAVCVYFDGDTPFGVAAAKASGGKIEAEAIAASYKPVSKDMLKGSADLSFTPAEISADDGTALPAFVVIAKEKPKA